ncbi:methyltransferase [Corynebacterium sp. TAE3-ERU12]|uniref:DUF7782 domain-containing protein n=1 Tax=Corynebacterium sp. TAE3-ERU12 TaxID=2849491 RepID=UPI001C48E196|nr:methyltransferase [Corynebacterium sp. TAE3-ERU12]MBV7295316.1 methyltransferase [Corynebacterium sp. TAE3-ERU12]
MTPPTTEKLNKFAGHAATLAQALHDVGFSPEGLSAALSDDGICALDRGEPAGVLWALDRAGDAGSTVSEGLRSVIRGVVVGEPAPLREVFGDELTDALVDCDVLAATESGELYATIDIRPITVGETTVFAFSDRDASMRPHIPGRDHVPGVGRASRSLLDITPCSPVGSVLDLGGGCGIQALGQLSAGSLVVTDISERANAFARASLNAAGRVDAEVLTGSWFAPVAGRTFDRIVANPPFVVGPPEVGHVYRDSGLDLDGATELLLRQIPDYLAEDGTAHLLGAWVTSDDESWESRLASWLPAEGVEAWIVQRDHVDAMTYVGTWLRDESVDPRTEHGRERMRRWVQHLHDHGVTGVGFGYITLHAITGPSEVTCEVMPQALGGSFAEEAEEFLARSQWLRHRSADDILDASFQVRPDVAIEKVELADVEARQGFEPITARVCRTDGPRWSHDTDPGTTALLGALHPDIPLRVTVELMAEFGAFGDGDGTERSVGVIVDLVRHGIVLPTDLVVTEDADEEGMGL